MLYELFIMEEIFYMNINNIIYFIESKSTKIIICVLSQTSWGLRMFNS